MTTETMDEATAQWKRDEQRVQEVRAIPLGVPLVDALSVALDIPVEIGDASSMRPIAMGALKHLEHAHPDRVEHFAQRLVDEVDGEAGVYDSAIDCCTSAGGASGPELVLRILNASPADICRAIILSMPERNT